MPVLHTCYNRAKQPGQCLPSPGRRDVFVTLAACCRDIAPQFSKGLGPQGKARVYARRGGAHAQVQYARGIFCEIQEINNSGRARISVTTRGLHGLRCGGRNPMA